MQHPPEPPIPPNQQTGYDAQGSNGGSTPYPMPSEQIHNYPQQGNFSGQWGQNPSGPMGLNANDERTQHAVPQPSYGSQPYDPYRQTPLPPVITPQPSASQSPLRSLPRTLLLLLVALVVLLIGGSGLIYFFAVYQPNQLHVQATATSVAQSKATADTLSTSTAHTIETTTAQNNATATVSTQATAEVNATQTALQNIYTQATSGTPTMNDSLSAPDNYGWSNISGTCAFTGGTYHVLTTPGYFTACYATSTNFSNFAEQVDMTIVNGHSGGLAFRTNSSTDAGYEFRISTDGTYILHKLTPVGNGKIQHSTLASGNSSAIVTDNNQSNTLTTVANGDSIYLYVNKQFVTSFSDNTYKSGQVGLFTDSDAQGVDASFKNFKVWKL